ncbi:MAG TPA: hypothetical protein VFY78_04180, partial [Gammaproteobacteria bacterium]|nr:hypothetical protein [Gammaproteobacteria bacterium]
ALLQEETEVVLDDSGLEGAYEQTSAPKTRTVISASGEMVKLTLGLQEKDSNTLLVITDDQGKPVTDGFAYDAMQMLANLLK